MVRRNTVTGLTNSHTRRNAALRRKLSDPAVLLPPTATTTTTVTPPRDASRFPSPVPSPGLAAVQELIAGARPATWVFTGDSITHGGRHTDGTRCFVEH